MFVRPHWFWTAQPRIQHRHQKASSIATMQDPSTESHKSAEDRSVTMATDPGPRPTTGRNHGKGHPHPAKTPRHVQQQSPASSSSHTLHKNSWTQPTSELQELNNIFFILLFLSVSKSWSPHPVHRLLCDTGKIILFTGYTFAYIIIVLCMYVWIVFLFNSQKIAYCSGSQSSHPPPVLHIFDVSLINTSDSDHQTC